MEGAQSLQLSPILGLNVPLENEKYCSRTKVFAKTASVEISNRVSPRSQKNHRILVKLICPQRPCQRLIRYSRIVYNGTISLPVLDAQFHFLCICCSRLYLEEALRVFGLGPNCTHFVNNIRLSWNLTTCSPNSCKNTVSSILENSNFTETGNLHKMSVFGPTLTPVYPLKMARGCTGEFVLFLLNLIDSKVKIFKANRKKSLYRVSNYSTILVVTEIYISSSLFYFSFFIDNMKPTCLYCVNSDIYSCILSLLKLHGTFSFIMN